MTDQRLDCPDCGDLDRRTFVKTVGAGALAASSMGLISRGAFAAPSMKSPAETNAAKLYETLSGEQRKVVCMPWSDPKRTRINANWDITKPGVGTNFYTKEQQALIRDIFKGATSEDGYERFLKQTDQDGGGFDLYTMALFGEPGTERFEWVFTGRHLTLRADGNSVDGMAFGGGLVYGHGESDPAQNMFHYQTLQANEVFKALEGKEREEALLTKAPKETDVDLQGVSGKFPGIKVSQLKEDQKALFEKTLKTILAPYRDEDVREAMEIIEAGGGIDNLRIAFYQQGDLNDDRTWDIWRIEGPTFVSHFRGAPHVHAYIHVGTKV